MAYSARISQASRQTIVFVIDQSGSMSEDVMWGNNPTTKADAVCDVVNGALGELLARCNNYGEFKSYFNIAVLGYGGFGIKSLLGEGRQNFFTPSELAYNWNRIVECVNIRQLPDGTECTTKSNKKVWIEPCADGRTPLVGALNYVFDILAAGLAQDCNKDCFPPLVINITDGEATDGTEEQFFEAARKVKGLSTNDGNVLLMNVHISNCDCDSIVFPSSTERCPLESKFAKLLFDTSSVMPEFFDSEIEMISSSAKPYKAFAYNASISDLVRMVNIGSSSTSLIV